MKQSIFMLMCAGFATLAFGQETEERAQKIVIGHILPRFERLAKQTTYLAQVAEKECAADSAALRSAFTDAFDALLAASHLRFGPMEMDNRSFALAFWPDPRGSTPKSLEKLIQANDPIIQTPQDFNSVSIAARGFYALEFLIYDPVLSTAGEALYHCRLIQTIAKDIQKLAVSTLADWQDEYAMKMLDPSIMGPYRSKDEVDQELFKALSAGLQFTSEMRLGRPLGTFDRPRPRRAEAWRSGRSSHHVAISLSALRDLSLQLAPAGSFLEERLQSAFDRAQSQLTSLDDPIFAGVAIVQTRIKVEIVQQSIEAIRDIIRNELGPELGVNAGFNAMDGD